jgi:hypothetical protein
MWSDPGVLKNFKAEKLANGSLRPARHAPNKPYQIACLESADGALVPVLESARFTPLGTDRENV